MRLAGLRFRASAELLEQPPIAHIWGLGTSSRVLGVCSWYMLVSCARAARECDYKYDSDTENKQVLQCGRDALRLSMNWLL